MRITQYHTLASKMLSTESQHQQRVRSAETWGPHQLSSLNLPFHKISEAPANAWQVLKSSAQ